MLANYGITDGQEQGWTSEIIIASLAGGVLLFAALILFELSKRDAAMIDFRLFRIPAFATVTFNAFASRMFSFGMMPFIILWLAGQLELSALEIGYVSSALAVPMVIFSAVGMVMTRWIPVGVVQAIGMFIVAGGLMLGLLMDTESGWADLLPMYLVLGTGTGLMLPHVMSLAVAVVPTERTGMATGLANTALPLGTAFGVAVTARTCRTVNPGSTGWRSPGMPEAVDSVRDATEGGLFREIAAVSQDIADETGFFIDGLQTSSLAAVLAVLALASLIASADGRTARRRPGREDCSCFRDHGRRPRLSRATRRVSQTVTVKHVTVETWHNPFNSSPTANGPTSNRAAVLGGRRGRHFRNNRRVVEGIIYPYRAGIAWRDLPECFGPWRQWKRQRRCADGTRTPCREDPR